MNDILEFSQYLRNSLVNGNKLMADCPFCDDDRRRFHLDLDKKYAYCHNCVGDGFKHRWNPKEVIDQLGMDYEANRDIDFTREIRTSPIKEPHKFETINLPDKAVKLDRKRIEWALKNKDIKNHAEIILDVLRVIKKRKLNKAINKPEFYYYNPTSKRLLVPFYNIKHELIYYAERAIYQDQSPKYLFCHGTKPLLGIDCLDLMDNEKPVILVEGVLDQMFVSNSVSMGGISFTDNQSFQLSDIVPNKSIVYAFDNHRIDNTGLKRSLEICDKNKGNDKVKLFLYPDSKYKDFAEYCEKNDVSEYPAELIQQNTFDIPTARIKLLKIKEATINQATYENEYVKKIKLKKPEWKPKNDLFAWSNS